MSRPARIISGGQTGADLGGLRAGRALGYVPGETLGGMMPRGYRNELGERPWMHEMYGMTEHRSPAYQPRTKANIQDADVTLIFGETASPGSRIALSFLGGFKTPFFVNPALDDGADVDGLDWRALCANATVNIAGNRESGNRGIEAYVYRWCIEAWGDDEQKARLIKCAPWPAMLPRLSPSRQGGPRV